MIKRGQLTSTLLKATASFASGSLSKTLSNVDITHLLTFKVQKGSANAVVITGDRVTGKSVASEIVIGCVGAAACGSAKPVKLSVSNTQVKVTG